MSPTRRRSIHVLVFGASLRRGSFNDALATLAAQVVERNGGTVDRAHMADFDSAFYNADVEAELGFPAGAETFCRRLIAAHAYVIASPEYNASMPAALKNLIDWASRMRPQPFNGKQGLLLSASPSMAGGNRGLWALRVPLEHLGSRVYPDMFSLAQAHQAFNDRGCLADDLLQKRFDETIRCFMDLVEAATHYRTLEKQWVEFLGEHPDRLIDRVETTKIAAA